jgi:hypothetical protein
MKEIKEIVKQSIILENRASVHLFLHQTQVAVSFFLKSASMMEQVIDILPDDSPMKLVAISMASSLYYNGNLVSKSHKLINDGIILANRMLPYSENPEFVLDRIERMNNHKNFLRVSTMS